MGNTGLFQTLNPSTVSVICSMDFYNEEQSRFNSVSTWWIPSGDLFNLIESRYGFSWVQRKICKIALLALTRARILLVYIVFKVRSHCIWIHLKLLRCRPVFGHTPKFNTFYCSRLMLKITNWYRGYGSPTEERRGIISTSDNKSFINVYAVQVNKWCGKI